MAMPKPSATPVTDSTKRRIKDGESTERVVKLSNMTRGRLVTLLESLPVDSYFRGEVEYAQSFLDRTRKTLEDAGKARDAALKTRDDEVRKLEAQLDKLNVDSQEISNIQDAITIILAAVPIVVGAVATAPVSMAVGGIAAIGSYVNSKTRSSPEEDSGYPGSEAELFGDGVDIAAQRAEQVAKAAGKAGPRFTGGLGVVSAAAAVDEVVRSKGIDAKLTDTTNDGFNKLDEQIENAGTFVDKDDARAASSKARQAQRDLNRAELKLKQAQAAYLQALRFAESVTWIMPR
jgi:hypothetical protein